MKIKQMNQKEIAKLNKILGDCDIITFDPKKIKRRIEKAYQMRTKAHDLMLESDILLDEIIKELYGDSQAKDLGQDTKGRRLGKKV